MLVNFIWFTFAVIILSIQNFLPWNPDGIKFMEPSFAFNYGSEFYDEHKSTALFRRDRSFHISASLQCFVFCSLFQPEQAYGLHYFSKVFHTEMKREFNFYGLFLNHAQRILLPLSVIIAFILIINGTPATFSGAKNNYTFRRHSIHSERTLLHRWQQ